MGNSTKKQWQKRGRDIHCLSAGGASWDGPRAEQLFVRDLLNTQSCHPRENGDPRCLKEFLASFFHQGKKKGLAGEANDKVLDNFRFLRVTYEAHFNYQMALLDGYCEFPIISNGE